jgi:CcmD family protein
MQTMQGSNWIFVAAAYAAAWIAIGGYALHVHRTLRRARRSLAQSGGLSSTGASWR